MSLYSKTAGRLNDPLDLSSDILSHISEILGQCCVFRSEILCLSSNTFDLFQLLFKSLSDILRRLTFVLWSSSHLSKFEVILMRLEMTTVTF